MSYEEIEADRTDAALRAARDRRRDVRRAMPPAEAPELGVRERLGPQRDARDPGLPKRPGVAALVGSGICLDRHLGVRGEPEPQADEVEQAGDRLPRQERRRPAAQVDGLEWRPDGAERLVQRVGAQRQLGAERTDKRRNPGSRAARSRPA